MDLAKPGSSQKRQDARDDARCHKFGFKPETDGYANCRLKLEEIRAAERLAARTRLRTAPPTLLQPLGPPPQYGNQGLSFMCKDAIARGDSGGVSIFC